MSSFFGLSQTPTPSLSSLGLPALSLLGYGSEYPLIATLGPILESQLSWKSLTRLSLQDRATKWYYFPNSNPPTWPPTTNPATHPPVPSYKFVTSISQQPRIWSFSYFKVRLRGPNQKWRLFNRRRPLLENDFNLENHLKQFIANYLSNQESSSIHEFKLVGQNQNWKGLRCRWPRK